MSVNSTPLHFVARFIESMGLDFIGYSVFFLIDVDLSCKQVVMQRLYYKFNDLQK